MKLSELRRWERPILLGGLLLMGLAACAATVRDLISLGQMGSLPWTYAGATLDPLLVPSWTPTPTPVPPTPTGTPRPTVIASTRTCMSDQLVLETVEPELDNVVFIEKTRLSATVYYCLRSRIQARLGVGLIPANASAGSRFIAYGEITVVDAGEGRLTRRLNWNEVALDLPTPGPYRIAAILVDEFGNQIASIATVKEYTLRLEPTRTPRSPTPTPAQRAP
jgi:hypothetical protein